MYMYIVSAHFLLKALGVMCELVMKADCCTMSAVYLHVHTFMQLANVIT